MRDFNENSGESKAERTPFLKFYTGDWIAGTFALSFEEKGFYLECLLRMWERKDALPDNDQWLAGSLNCNPRTVRKLKTALVAAGKLEIRDGTISNPRLMKEIATHKLRSNSARIRGELGSNSARIGSQFELNAAEKQAKSTKPPAKQNTPIFQKPESREERVSSEAATASRIAVLPDDQDLERSLIEACNGALDNPVNCMGLLSLATPKMWIAQGCDLERDVLPTLKAAGKKYHGKRIRDWGYFSGMVADAKARREKGLPAANSSEQPKRQDWASERKQRAMALVEALKAGAVQ